MRRAHQSNGSPYSQYSRDAVEEENEEMVEGLKTKITALKSLSIDIGQEVRSQNGLLREMDGDFDSFGGILSSAMGRLGKLSKAGHNRYIFYLLLFSFFVFFVIYLILKFR
ncbi:BET1 homolog [Limulus polyphemus]|uniref:BET1 homolog n=1 Tax=Limulus polyphemus TaxID=6850 RepID=A0ABM1BU75_LIMPO|nr:BET1 homolog [Limulus polyphemus]